MLYKLFNVSASTQLWLHKLNQCLYQSQISFPPFPLSFFHFPHCLFVIPSFLHSSFMEDLDLLLLYEVILPTALFILRQAYNVYSRMDTAGHHQVRKENMPSPREDDEDSVTCLLAPFESSYVSRTLRAKVLDSTAFLRQGRRNNSLIQFLNRTLTEIIFTFPE